MAQNEFLKFYNQNVSETELPLKREILSPLSSAFLSIS